VRGSLRVQPEFVLFLQEFLRASQFRIFLSDDFPGIVRHQYHANSFFFSSALRADRTEPVAVFAGQGDYWRTFGVLFFV